MEEPSREPLSMAAQKILAVLQAQSKAARHRHRRYPTNQRLMGAPGTQTKNEEAWQGPGFSSDNGNPSSLLSIPPPKDEFCDIKLFPCGHHAEAPTVKISTEVNLGRKSCLMPMSLHGNAQHLNNIQVSTESSTALPCLRKTSLQESRPLNGRQNTSQPAPQNQVLPDSLKRKHELLQNRTPPPQVPLHFVAALEPKTNCFHKPQEMTTGLQRRRINDGAPNSCSKPGWLAAILTSDCKVKDAEALNLDAKRHMFEVVRQAQAVLLTMVYRDGNTQLHSGTKLTSPVCGILLLLKNDLDSTEPQDSLGLNDLLLYLKLDFTPTWAQQHTQQTHRTFTRDLLLQVLFSAQVVVCYKAKNLLCTVLQLYRQHISWKQVSGCNIQDPQVSGWLLDPGDPCSTYQGLLKKHFRASQSAPAQSTTQVISDLCSLYWLNEELCYKLQSQGLWKMYLDMELNMIPILAVMESHRIHVDKDVVKKMSDLLGAKMKQLEEEAHRAAGQMFLVTSNIQLRTVLFEKLRLHELCENKRLPKTFSTQQQSTSEAAVQHTRTQYMYIKCHCSITFFKLLSFVFLAVDAATGFASSAKNYFRIQTGPQNQVYFCRRDPFVHDGQGLHFLHVVADECGDGQNLCKAPKLPGYPKTATYNQQEAIHTWKGGRGGDCSSSGNVHSSRRLGLCCCRKGVSEQEVTSEDREHAKRIVYSLVYGAGRERLSGILGVSVEQTVQFQDTFLQTYREIQTFIQTTIQQSHKQGYVCSIMGRRRILHNINSPDWAIRMQAERQAVNFMIQGSAADLCKMAMIRVFNLVCSSSSLSVRLIAQLHDELLWEVEESHVQEFAALVKRTMEGLRHIDHTGVHLKVPLKVAVSRGKSWGSMSELYIPSFS
ncbi:DNA polymerase nu isoform X3 [Nerophis lumbriciformis]|uniref:DNA polymerase nu isoform X3 n=1 Tax=Nerophis lumbriciformis TaxID=546530 RepID=UPI002ADF960E|nr:DNA polymerase nu isoform X3 [Nerophis lumbriciformis]